MTVTWIAIAAVVVLLVLVGTYYELRVINWVKVARALGLTHHPKRTVATDVTHERIEGVIRGCTVSVTVEVYESEDRAGPVQVIRRQQHQDTVVTGVDMPDMPSALARALVWPRGEA